MSDQLMVSAHEEVFGRQPVLKGGNEREKVRVVQSQLRVLRSVLVDSFG